MFVNTVDKLINWLYTITYIYFFKLWLCYYALCVTSILSFKKLHYYIIYCISLYRENQYLQLFVPMFQTHCGVMNHSQYMESTMNPKRQDKTIKTWICLNKIITKFKSICVYYNIIVIVFTYKLFVINLNTTIHVSFIFHDVANFDYYIPTGYNTMKFY